MQEALFAMPLRADAIVHFRISWTGLHFLLRTGPRRPFNSGGQLGSLRQSIRNFGGLRSIVNWFLISAQLLGLLS